MGHSSNRIVTLLSSELRLHYCTRLKTLFTETKMVSKILLFLLIAGVFAQEPIVEREEDDIDFDQDLEESEDYDEVEEVDEDEEERDLSDDMQMLDSDSMNEVKAFCADPANAGDPVCSVPM